MFIDGMFQFYLYLFQTVHYNLFFLFGQVQRLTNGIRKIRVFFYTLSQGSATNQIGMENNTEYLWLDFVFEHFYAGGLTGSKADNRSFLIIIILTPIFDITTFCFFQKECVKAIIHLNVIDRLCCFCQVYNTYQRVQGFKSVQTVVLIDTFQFDYLIHKQCFLLKPYQRYKLKIYFVQGDEVNR